MEEKFYTPQEFAKLTGYTIYYVRKLTSKGLVKAYRYRDYFVRIPESELQRFLEKRNKMVEIVPTKLKQSTHE